MERRSFFGLDSPRMGSLDKRVSAMLIKQNQHLRVVDKNGDLKNPDPALFIEPPRTELTLEPDPALVGFLDGIVVPCDYLAYGLLFQGQGAKHLAVPDLLLVKVEGESTVVQPFDVKGNTSRYHQNEVINAAQISGWNTLHLYKESGLLHKAIDKAIETLDGKGEPIFRDGALITRDSPKPDKRFLTFLKDSNIPRRKEIAIRNDRTRLRKGRKEERKIVAEAGVAFPMRMKRWTEFKVWQDATQRQFKRGRRYPVPITIIRGFDGHDRGVVSFQYSPEQGFTTYTDNRLESLREEIKKIPSMDANRVRHLLHKTLGEENQHILSLEEDLHAVKEKLTSTTKEHEKRRATLNQELADLLGRNPLISLNRRIPLKQNPVAYEEAKKNSVRLSRLVGKKPRLWEKDVETALETIATHGFSTNDTDTTVRRLSSFIRERFPEMKDITVARRIIRQKRGEEHQKLPRDEVKKRFLKVARQEDRKKWEEAEKAHRRYLRNLPEKWSVPLERYESAVLLGRLKRGGAIKPETPLFRYDNIEKVLERSVNYAERLLDQSETACGVLRRTTRRHQGEPEQPYRHYLRQLRKEHPFMKEGLAEEIIATVEHDAHRILGIASRYQREIGRLEARTADIYETLSTLKGRIYEKQRRSSDLMEQLCNVPEKMDESEFQQSLREIKTKELERREERVKQQIMILNTRFQRACQNEGKVENGDVYEVVLDLQRGPNMYKVTVVPVLKMKK